METSGFIVFRLGSERKKRTLARIGKDLCDPSGDGSLSSPSGAIKPEHEGICIAHVSHPFNDLVDHGNSRVRMAVWRIGAVI